MGKLFLFLMLGFCLWACNNQPETSPAGSSIKAIDPDKRLRDTSRFALDSSKIDSPAIGVMH